MNSKQISRFIGKSVFLRKFGYFIIYMTTLREWYIRRGIRSIVQQMNKKFTLLDAGFGLGQHIYSIARRYSQADIIGIEQDVGQVEDMRHFIVKTGLKNISLHAADLQQSSLELNADIVLCCSVLEHIEEDCETLVWFWQHLKANGYLLVYVPTAEKRILHCLSRKIARVSQQAGYTTPHGHVRYYSPETLRDKLEKAGFTVKLQSVTYGWTGRLAYDIVTSVQYSKWFKLIFPIYFVLIHPFVLLFMFLDYIQIHESGNGLMCIAQKQAA